MLIVTAMRTRRGIAGLGFLAAAIGLGGCSVLDGLLTSEDVRSCVPEVLTAAPGATTASIYPVTDDRFLVQYGYRGTGGLALHNTLDVSMAEDGEGYVAKYQALSGDAVAAAAPMLKSRCGVTLRPQAQALVLPSYVEPPPADPSKETLLDRLRDMY